MCVAHLTTREHVDEQGWDCLDFQGLCRTGPDIHQLGLSGEEAQSLSSSGLSESRPCTLPRQHSGAGPSD